jgi:hypothetical protein
MFLSLTPFPGCARSFRSRAEAIVARMEPRWWTMRPAQSLKPASYVCPFCDGMLHATSEHALVAPEGDVSKRRHAHLQCVVEARRKGTLRTEDEWRKRR